MVLIFFDFFFTFLKIGIKTLKLNSILYSSWEREKENQFLISWDDLKVQNRDRPTLMLNNLSLSEPWFC